MEHVALEEYGLKSKELVMAGLIKFHLGRFDRTVAYEKVKLAVESVSRRKLLIKEATQALEMSNFDTGSRETQEATYMLFKYGNFDRIAETAPRDLLGSLWILPMH